MTGSLTNIQIRKLDDRGILMEFQQNDQYSDQTIRCPRKSYDILENDRKFDQYSDQKIR